MISFEGALSTEVLLGSLLLHGTSFFNLLYHFFTQLRKYRKNTILHIYGNLEDIALLRVDRIELPNKRRVKL